jgi:hypothetical protein
MHIKLKNYLNYLIHINFCNKFYNNFIYKQYIFDKLDSFLF